VEALLRETINWGRSLEREDIWSVFLEGSLVKARVPPLEPVFYHLINNI
jgi:hypothetical protein